MKIIKPVLQDPENILAAKAEQAVLSRLPVDRKTVQLAGRILEPKNLKRIGIAAAAGSVLISIASTVGHNSAYKAMVAKEMKKQIAPLEQKLDELRAQNAVLQQQNLELIALLKKPEKEE